MLFLFAFERFGVAVSSSLSLRAGERSDDVLFFFLDPGPGDDVLLFFRDPGPGDDLDVFGCLFLLRRCAC